MTFPFIGKFTFSAKSKDVAAYIAQQCNERGIFYNNTKIQKLLYCVYGVVLAWRNERVCREQPEAWRYGPVFPKVFFYVYKGKDIAHYSTRIADKRDADNYTAQAVERVIETFGKFTPPQLSDWSRKPGSPWHIAVNGWGEEIKGGGLKCIIPDEFIKPYFAANILNKDAS